MAMLYHVSNWAALASLSVGDAFTLKPGSQNAEGVGVYFAEGAPRLAAADGCQHSAPVAIVAIEASTPAGWWQSKGGKARKFGKPRTWHSDGKQVQCVVESVSEGRIPVLSCSWRWL